VGSYTGNKSWHTNFKPRKIDKIFITSSSRDHYFWIAGLIVVDHFQGGESPLLFMALKGITNFLFYSLKGVRDKFEISTEIQWKLYEIQE